MYTILAYTVAGGIPAATIALGAWTIRRHNRIYPPHNPLERRSRRRFG